MDEVLRPDRRTYSGSNAEANLSKESDAVRGELRGKTGHRLGSIGYLGTKQQRELAVMGSIRVISNVNSSSYPAPVYTHSSFAY